jgi:hypothetical protein
MDKLKTLNFGIKLYNKLITLYPDLLNKTKKKKESFMNNSNMMQMTPGMPVMGMNNMQNMQNMFKMPNMQNMTYMQNMPNMENMTYMPNMQNMSNMQNFNNMPNNMPMNNYPVNTKQYMPNPLINSSYLNDFDIKKIMQNNYNIVHVRKYDNDQFY